MTTEASVLAGEISREPDLDRDLTLEQARARLLSVGPNELPAARRDGLLRRFARHLAEPMPILLIVAAGVAWLGLRERLDAGVIFAIVMANIVIALFQEGKTASALRALRNLETPVARVRRSGNVRRIPAQEVVPGDIVLLAAGDRVPADLRLISSTAFEVDESMLTGESLPVAKNVASVAGHALDEPHVFAGTHVVRGSGVGVTEATGARTELGKIAKHLASREPLTPLQRELRVVTARLGFIAVAIAVMVFGATLLRLGVGRSGFEMAFLTSAALAVAAVPEGLPTVVTVGLALGVRRMAGRGSIVRRLPAVETLGSTTVILTDKTGTLTQNKMRLDSVTLADGSSSAIDDLPRSIEEAFARAMALCNDAAQDPPTGDPLEIALLDALGEERAHALRLAHPRIDARPFDSQTRSMSTLNATDDRAVLLMKGAPEVVLARCTRSLRQDGGSEASIGPDERAQILVQVEQHAEAGARVLALANKKLAVIPPSLEAEEFDLTFIGLVSLRDPVRPEAARAVAEARAAGIQILMVTGDHPGTASTIAREVGLAHAGSAIAVGADLKRDGLPADPTSVSVYARVDPEDKLGLTEALQDLGHVVAVTGDGVNDAPALRRADIGVAMGRSGSDVAREAADMVVTDDNLVTIVHAIREGRGIYDNIRKVVEYLVAGNLSEILVVVGGLTFFPGLGVPLLPLQLLWLNLLTDGFPALALGVDPHDPDLMQRTPRPRSDHLLSGRRLSRLFVRAVLISSAALGALAFTHFVWNEPWTHARSSMFSVLMTAHLLYAFAVRRSDGRAERVNPWLYAAVGGGLALQATIISIPAMQRIFSTATLSLREWILVAIAGALPVALIHAISMLRAARSRAQIIPR